MFVHGIKEFLKTNKKDAQLITLYGLSFSLNLWKPISEEFETIKDLCRVLSVLNGLKHLKSITKNRKLLL